MKSSICYFIVSAFTCFLFSSCEDEELVKKNEELRVQLSELEKKADMAEINAGEDPGDQTEAVKKVNEELNQALSKLEELDNEKTAIEKQQSVAEKELRDYQSKYRIQ